MKLTFAFFATVLSFIAVAEACPNGWHPSSGKCFFISKQAATWFEAVGFCRALGAHLAETTNNADLARLKRLIRNTGQFYWLGATDMFYDGHWRWIKSGSYLRLDNWYPNEPNGGLRENCLDIYPYVYQQRFNDAQCQSRYFFICEK